MRFYDIKTAQRIEIDRHDPKFKWRKDGKHLNFEEEVRRIVAAGAIPSVTTQQELIVAPHLIDWKIKQACGEFARTGDITKAITFDGAEDSSEAGTGIHDYLEKATTGQPVDPGINDILRKAGDPARKFFEKECLCVFEAEEKFADEELWVAGTPDTFWMSRTWGPILTDFKAKKHSRMFPMKPAPEYQTQLSCYRRWVAKKHGMKWQEIRIANILLASPANDYYEGPHMEFFLYDQEDDWWDVFLAKQAVWKHHWLGKKPKSILSFK